MVMKGKQRQDYKMKPTVINIQWILAMSHMLVSALLECRTESGQGCDLWTSSTLRSTQESTSHHHQRFGLSNLVSYLPISSLIYPLLLVLMLENGPQCILNCASIFYSRTSFLTSQIPWQLFTKFSSRFNGFHAKAVRPFIQLCWGDRVSLNFSMEFPFQLVCTYYRLSSKRNPWQFFIKLQLPL